LPALWPFLDAGPVPLPPAAAWAALVNSAQTEAELARLRACVYRDRPFGVDTWVQGTAVALELESSLRPRGRPPKGTSEAEAPPEEPTLFI
jgi:putative transposase